jgi:hypothetical protein
MPAPSIDPNKRDPSDVAPTDSYHPNDPVWIFRDGVWRAGIVDGASAFAATVIYRSNAGRGLGVDIRTAPYVLARNEVDPMIDAL